VEKKNCVLKFNPMTFTRLAREFYLAEIGEKTANKVINKEGKIPKT
jgi:hypothetical protein